MSWFSDFVSSVREAFGGKSRSDDNDSGSSRAPSRSQPPPQRPSIMTVGSERVATRDMPRYGITAGQRTSEPEYSPFSLRALTSTDPANVMRNIQGAERNLAAFPPGGGDDNRSAAPPPPPKPPEPTPPPPPPPAPPVIPWWEQPIDFTSGLTFSQAERVQTAGERAAEQQSKRGRAQTIATSPAGIVSTGETTRRRRSLVGGEAAPTGLLVEDEADRERRSLMSGGLIR